MKYPDLAIVFDTYDIKCTIYYSAQPVGSDLEEDVYLPPNEGTTVNFDITTE